MGLMFCSVVANFSPGHRRLAKSLPVWALQLLFAGVFQASAEPIRTPFWPPYWFSFLAFQLRKAPTLRLWLPVTFERSSRN